MGVRPDVPPRLGPRRLAERQQAGRGRSRNLRGGKIYFTAVEGSEQRGHPSAASQTYIQLREEALNHLAPFRNIDLYFVSSYRVSTLRPARISSHSNLFRRDEKHRARNVCNVERKYHPYHV